MRSAVGAIALVLGAVAPIGVASSPAHAATCTAQQVDVVVDFGSLGGGIRQGCAPAGGNAASAFGAAGYLLRYAQQIPGAVCQVNGEPADAPCQQMPPGNAYWGLFWTDGSTSRWTYSSFGVQSLAVPAGGSVAFAWQSSTTPRYPGVAPVVTRSKTASKPPATHHARRTRAARPTATPSASAATTRPATGTPSVSPSPSLSPVPASSAASASGTVPTFTESPTPSVSPSVSPPAADSADTNSGLPAWVPVGLVGVLILGAGVIVALRRRA